MPGIRGPANRPGQTFVLTIRKGRAKPHSSQHVRPRVSLLTNDNQCVKFLLSRRLTRSKQTLNCVSVPPGWTRVWTDCKLLSASCEFCKLKCCFSCTFVQGQQQKKGISRVTVKQNQQLKCVNNVSCVDELCSVKTAPNVPLVQNLPVGARLNQFWETWETLGVGPKVVQMLKEGYTLPFQTRPNLTRSPTIISCYVNPHRNLYLLEALHQLTDKNAIELVTNQESLHFYNRLFLVPKPNNKWRPILDLSNLNKFLKVEKLKKETPETIRTSVQTGEWVISIDFKIAYFHIPIQNQSRKYLKVSCTGQNIPLQSTTLSSVHSSIGVHGCCQRGQIDGFTKGYKNPPVPR